MHRHVTATRMLLSNASLSVLILISPEHSLAFFFPHNHNRHHQKEKKRREEKDRRPIIPISTSVIRSHNKKIILGVSVKKESVFYIVENSVKKKREKKVQSTSRVQTNSTNTSLTATEPRQTSSLSPQPSPFQLGRQEHPCNLLHSSAHRPCFFLGPD